ncbi:MAG: spore protein O [Candidatus Koribacter versatilis]|nr:spore protein O [Candidatus Koribacter versatilis]
MEAILHELQGPARPAKENAAKLKAGFYSAPLETSMSDRKLLWTARLLLTLFVAVAGPAFSQNPPKAVMAYYENSASDRTLRLYASYLNQIPTDSFAIERKGNIRGAAPAEVLAFARSRGMQTFATVSNYLSGYRSGIAHTILNDPAIRATAIRNMLAVVQTNGYSGINIDFEAILPKDRTAFSGFIGEVALAMRAAGYLTVVSVPAKVRDNPHDSWSGAFDYTALGRDADLLQLMTYDEHAVWGSPGPVAGLDWVERCVRYALSAVPASKISMGMPAYGYDWNLTKKPGRPIFWKQIPALVKRVGAVPLWDATSSSPYFFYTAGDGASHVVWYENPESISLKSRLVVTYDLEGVSVFALGFENRKFWEAVSAGLGNAGH